MKQRIFGWISSFIGIAMAIVVVELTATAWLMIEDGRYTPAPELFERTQNAFVRDVTKGSACRYIDTLYPHPYVSFVHHANAPCGLTYTNNVGLFGPDFPTVKRDDRYTVMLVGGSVASQLGQNFAPPAPRYLEEELNKNYVSPNGKPFEVLNGGDGSWKEPQSFILFSLYASSVDAVLTVDGFNEHFFFRPGTKQRLEGPFNNFAEVNPFVADENFGDAAIGWVMGRVAGSLALNPILGHSHAAYMVIRGIESVAKGKDSFKSNKRTTIDSIFAMPEEIRKDPERFFAVQLGLYQKYTRGVEAIARDYNVKTAYFLQPIPAYGKTLSEEEKGLVGDLGYRDLYRRIVAGILTLRERGMAVYDLGDLLEGEKDTFYIDHIHFFRDKAGESRGYRLMAARVARDLAATWGLQPKR